MFRGFQRTCCVSHSKLKEQELSIKHSKALTMINRVLNPCRFYKNYSLNPFKLKDVSLRCRYREIRLRIVSRKCRCKKQRRAGRTVADIDLIFHVDDDDDILDLARMSLEMAGGYNVVQSNDPAKALEKIKEIKPTLLLFDVMMPGLTGPQLYQEIRKIPGCEHLRVIFMTAKAQALQTDELQFDGVMGVLAKPFDPMELPNQVLQVWTDNQ